MPAAAPGRRGAGRPLLPLTLALAACFAVASAQTPTLSELRASAPANAVVAAAHNASATSPLGRKDLADSCPAAGTSAACAAAAVPAAPAPANTTLPFSLEDLGYLDFANGTAEGERRRRLMTTVYHSVSQSYCKISRDVLLQGGRLLAGVSAIKDVPTPAACCARCAFISGCDAWTWARRTKICYPKGAEGWKSVPSNLHVSGHPRRPPVRPAPAPAPLRPKPAAPGAGRLLWEGNLVEGDHQLRRSFAKEIKIVEKANNKMVVADPTGTGTDPVIRVRYAPGCWSPEADCGGGALFYAWPNGRTGSIGEAARLEYEVFFPSDFTFNKGGKLPGMQGGPMGCGGGADAGAMNCWSVRLMWRREGEGEAYIYVDPAKQAPDFCTGPGTVCDAHAGTSLERGRFSFKRGQWNRIALTVRMNDVGKKNGVVQLDIDGDTKILYEKAVYRTTAEPTLDIDSFIFASWFGGSDKSWAPSTRQEAYFRNFKIYKLD